MHFLTLNLFISPPLMNHSTHTTFSMNYNIYPHNNVHIMLHLHDAQYLSIYNYISGCHLHSNLTFSLNSTLYQSLSTISSSFSVHTHIGIFLIESLILWVTEITMILYSNSCVFYIENNNNHIQYSIFSNY
jgi:hypothetical protein